jgi:hypothetical protein
LESSRCSCSLCSSQGAGCASETHEGHGEVLTRCAGGPRRKRAKAPTRGARSRSFKTE